MARAYLEDATHFRERGELEKALANVNYAHGWLDAGARVGLFDVGGDDQLFTLSERSEDARAFVVDAATLQRPEFQVQGRELLAVPRRDHRISEHGHHRPPEHAAGPNHFEDPFVRKTRAFGETSPEFEESLQRRTPGELVNERPADPVDCRDLLR